eukprot:6015465-Prymnesium_polylepis.1
MGGGGAARWHSSRRRAETVRCACGRAIHARGRAARARVAEPCDGRARRGRGRHAAARARLLDRRRCLLYTSPSPRDAHES